ncbi:MAG: DEAD/DEAH box helicase [Acidimicrobiia bacterium]|nr:DEAD/DEAH box helicase [Acidimicrobiia bacterium]
MDARSFAAERSLVLDSFQEEAMRALDEDASVLVSAPTGAGKTLIAEYAVFAAFDRGERAFYTTPIKALSNQKHRDLCEQLGQESVGLLTGDTSINPRAPIVVMTTEVLRNMIYADSDALEGLGTVVLDEVHYLQDRARGAVWEEVIVHLPTSVEIVCLSATVSNIEEFTGWLRDVRGDVVTVVEEQRPVPLEHFWVAGDRRDDLIVLPTFVRRKGELVANPEAIAIEAEHAPRRGGGRRRDGREAASVTPGASSSSRNLRSATSCPRSTSSSVARVATAHSMNAWPPACASPTAKRSTESVGSPSRTPSRSATRT